MSIKGEVKKTGEGRGLLGIALAVGLGVALFAPLVALGWTWVTGKFKKPATTPTEG